jgi:hypothetical protein
LASRARENEEAGWNTEDRIAQTLNKSYSKEILEGN